MLAVGMDIKEEAMSKHNPMTVAHEQNHTKICYIMKHITSQI